MWGDFFEFEQYHAQVATCNLTDRTGYQDRNDAILQRRAESHDNYIHTKHTGDAEKSA